MGRWRVDASGHSRWSSSSRQGGGREAKECEQTYHLQATGAHKGQQVLQPLGAVKGAVCQLPAIVGQKGGCTAGCERVNPLWQEQGSGVRRPASRAGAVSSRVQRLLSQRWATQGCSV